MNEPLPSSLPASTEGPRGAVNHVAPPADIAGGADADLLASLSRLDAGRDRALANRTRRAVSQAAADLREGGREHRRNSAIALLTLAGLLLLLSPAIWNSIDEVLGGETLMDMPGMIAAMAFTLFAAVAAVLFLLGAQGQRSFRQPRR